jgi:hypothetical protein
MPPHRGSKKICKNNPDKYKKTAYVSVSEIQARLPFRRQGAVGDAFFIKARGFVAVQIARPQ